MVRRPWYERGSAEESFESSSPVLEVLLSLASAASYGAADFCGGLASKRASVLSVAFAAQLVGLVLLALVMPFFPGTFTTPELVTGALAGICGALGIALLYHALSIGTMGVVSPVTAVLAAALPVVVSTALGDRLGPGQIAGIACALVAIALISLTREPDGTREFSTAGVKEAIASGLLLGGFYLFLARSPERAGLDALLCARVASIVVLLAAAFAVRTSFRGLRGSRRIVLASGALDMAANILYVLATYHGLLAIAAVLTSLYPASTVFLARIVLGERLNAVQRVGVVFALAGVALIAWRR